MAAKQQVQPYSKEQIRLRFIIAVRWLVANHPEVEEQNDLVEIIGTNKANFSRVFTSETNYPQDYWLSALVYHFNISGDWLLTGRGDMQAGRNVIERVQALEFQMGHLMKKK